MKKKFIIAPDSFKESLNSLEVAEAMKEGIAKIFPEAEYILSPMADGGEGTAEVIVKAKNGKFRKISVIGPLGKKIEARYGILEKENKAIIDIASACGLNLVPIGKRNPLVTTSFGVGEMIIDAMNLGYKNIIVGLGGSSTNDGGLGMLQALGVKAYDKLGEEIKFGGKELINIEKIDFSTIDPRIKNLNLEVACDVNNPLIGETGATRVFAAQKGADEATIKILEEAMIKYAQILLEGAKIEVATISKSGAAGGLGAAFIILGANLLSGIQLVFNSTDFEGKLKNADYIFTGEGSIDGQTKYGKTIVGIAKLAKKYEIPVIVLAGKVGKDIEELYNMGVTGIFSIIDRPKSLEASLEEAYDNIKITSENIARII